MKNLNALFMIAGILISLCAGAAQAEDANTVNPGTAGSTIQVNTSQCVEREVLMVVKSTRNVHYREEDEGRLISDQTIKIKDCGGLLVVDQTKDSGTTPSAGRMICPPGVQDCVRP